MKHSATKKILALALCMASIQGFSQKGNICSLGDIKNDSLLPYIDSLIIPNTTTATKMLTVLPEMKTLSYVEITGEREDAGWATTINALSGSSSLKTVCFSNNDLVEFPAGVRLPKTTEKLVIRNNDLVNYTRVLDQICDLNLLKELQLDVYSIFDLPRNADLPAQLDRLTIINKDEVISEDATTVTEARKQHAYEFFVNNGNQTAVKYISFAGMLDSDEYQELMKRFHSHYSYAFALKNFNDDEAFVPVYQHVKPPLKGLDVERTEYTINSGIENVLIYSSGTRIRIPANSFNDAEGKPITGSITLAYREFRDPVDILVSGIPMKYDSAGQSNDFESAGMFEIAASQGQQELKLAPGKNIDMNFVSTSKESTYNFYAYDDKTGGWTYKSKPARMTRETKIEDPVSPAATLFGRLFNLNRTFYDSTKIRQRFESPEFMYTVRLDSNINKKNKVWHNKLLGASYARNTFSMIKVTKVRKTRSGEVVFKLRFYNDSHPELKEFNNLYFASNENLSAAQFKNKYAGRNYFNDVRVYQKGQQVEIRLKGQKGNRFQTISADLVSLDDKGKVHTQRSITATMKSYNRRLRDREKAFDKLVKSGKNYYDRQFPVTDPQQRALFAYNGCRSTMTLKEKRMTQQEWMTYYLQLLEKEKQASNASAATSANVINSLSLDGMGIYNCDQIMRLEDPVQIFARYHTNDATLHPAATYIIDKRMNGVLMYNGVEGATSSKIAFSKSNNAQTTMLVVKKDGSLAVYKPEDFKGKEFSNNATFDFLVQNIGSTSTNVGDLKKLIGL